MLNCTLAVVFSRLSVLVFTCAVLCGGIQHGFMQMNLKRKFQNFHLLGFSGYWRFYSKPIIARNAGFLRAMRAFCGLWKLIISSNTCARNF